MNTTQARIKIHELPEPYRGYALEHIRDAERDLLRWPELRKEILKDMTESISTWEVVKNGAVTK